MANNKKATEDTGGSQDRSFDPYLVKDPEAMALNIARALENLGAAASAWLEPRQDPKRPPAGLGPAADMIRTMSSIASYWTSEPQRSLEAQTRLLGGVLDIWMRSWRLLSGEPMDTQPLDRGLGRFSDGDWHRNPFFDFLRQIYVLVSDWLQKLVADTQGLDDHARHRAEFYTRQILAAISPENFVLTNPQLFRETVATSGENLVRGMQMLREDILAGGGDLKIRHTDMNRFVLGKDLAVTPGKVVARNDLCEIIQYAASTETVFKRPLLICPPWINKFYILDLSPEKSIIRWLVEQGHTVFVISWVNPGRRHAEMGWENYIDDGINFALDTIKQATGENQVNAVGYCIGGTLLAVALALHAQQGDKRIKTASLLAAQVDFTYAGDLKIFIDEEQLAALEEHMSAIGYLDGAKMTAAFNLLRASELIWPYVVNNYLKGKDPIPFDLLFWNGDSTRVAAANHAFYLRQCYLNNALSRGEMRIGDRTLSLKDIKIPVYCLAAREDHIAPARSVYEGCHYFGGKVDFVLSGSGHIAGVVNPPTRQKYRYWKNATKDAADFNSWIDSANETPGSWWPHWQRWISLKSKAKVAAREPGGTSLTALGDAPGEYVMMR
ncbi:PHA/PHB synthase family protein [Oryzifoliimicrobium ureilyticus]|uniref:PHA/PHB synthase family protein n=1 Tax=Oryzifoliimicrobium ureilyticus TaxID=3113724 RepID=UPI00307624BA